MTFPTDDTPEVVPRCAVCRTRDADGQLYDAVLRTQFYWYCLDCLEEWWEREVAIAMNPDLARLLPPLPSPTWHPDREGIRRRRRV